MLSEVIAPVSPARRAGRILSKYLRYVLIDTLESGFTGVVSKNRSLTFKMLAKHRRNNTQDLLANA